MLAPVVFFSLVAAVAIAVWIRRAVRRRADRTMVVTTWPEIEFSQMYGGWDADAYDAGTGRDRYVARARTTRTPGRGLASRPPARPR